MQDNVLGLVILFFVLIVGNKLLALPQVYKLNKQLLSIKQSGPVSSVGLFKHWMGTKAYIIISEKDGSILQGYKMSGITVFARFIKDEDLKESSFQEILDNLEKKEKLSHQDKAKQMAARYLADGFTRLSEEGKESK